MRFIIRKNSVDSSIGVLAVEDGATTIKIAYDRDELAHELLNAYRDLFSTNEGWLKHLAHYLDKGDIKELSIE